MNLSWSDFKIFTTLFIIKFESLSTFVKNKERIATAFKFIKKPSSIIIRSISLISFYSKRDQNNERFYCIILIAIWLIKLCNPEGCWSGSLYINSLIGAAISLSELMNSDCDGCEGNALVSISLKV